MEQVNWNTGLEELEETLGTTNHPRFTDGERKHLRRRILDKEMITDADWKALIEYLVDNNAYLPKVKDFIGGLHAVRKFRGQQDRERVYVKCERCNPTGA